MSSLTARRKLFLIRRLLSKNRTYEDREIQQSFDAINLTLDQHVQLVMECINTLEAIRDEKEAQRGREQINSMIEKLHTLI
jgi:hypothetical protein